MSNKYTKAVQTWREQHREELLQYYKNWRKSNPERVRVLYKKQKDKLRLDILIAYGHTCACCGESRREFLSIDHINGMGHKPRNSHGQRITGVDFYRWLRRNGFPKDHYRLLCHNCNQSFGYHGYCPHDTERQVQAAKAS